MKELNTPEGRLATFKNLDQLIVPILNRIGFIARNELNDSGFALDNVSNIGDVTNSIVAVMNKIKHMNECDKSIVCWLIIAGNYPKVSQQKTFESRIQTFGIYSSIYWLIESVLINQELFDSAVSTILVGNSSFHLVDITHTSNYPHTTGIQRVVRKIAHEAKDSADVSFIKWDVRESRVLVLEKDYLFDLTHQTKFGDLKENIFLELFDKAYLHLGLWAESGFFKPKLKLVIRPLTRKLRSTLKGNQTGRSNHANGEGFIAPRPNVYILGHTITLLDVGMDHGPLYYSYLINSSIKFQAVLYDVIPIFHPEFFKGSGLTSSFSNYLSYVLKFDKIFAISNVVAEQAKLLNRAISLERPDWEMKETLVESINLPPGLEPINSLGSHSFDKKDPLFIMVGTIEPRKNHAQFLNALIILKQLGVSAKGLLIGINGWDNETIYENLRECIHQGVDIEHLDNISDTVLQNFYRKATAVLSLSEAEGYGLPIVEAAQFGVPVIATRIRPFLDLPVDDIHFVDIGDSVSLAEIMMGLVEMHFGAPHNFQVSEPIAAQPSWRDWSNRLFC